MSPPDAGRPAVLCLRPESDFLRVGVRPPASLAVAFREPGDGDAAELARSARAFVLASIGPRIDELLAGARELELVQFTGAGLDRVDGDALEARGVRVRGVGGTNAVTVAQYVVGAAIALLRRFPGADAEVRAGRWAEERRHLVGGGLLRDLGGLAVGIVGLGHIGLAVAAAFRGLDPSCSLAYFDPQPRDAAAADALGARPLALDALLRESDVVTVHVPLLPATRGLIGARELRLLRPDAVLVQASRGGVVDEAALAEALAAGRLAGAAVDVWEEEPPRSSPLLALEGEAARRLLLTPHVGGVSRQSERRQFLAAWEGVEAALVTA